MAGIGDLVVRLGVNANPFKSGLSGARGMLSSFAGSVKSAMVPVGALAASAGAAFWAVSERIGGLAEVADRAAQTGLSGKFLQQLEYAADQSGVSAETLTGGIKKLTIAIGNAGKGSKPAIEAFASLGLSAKELGQLSPEQQFKSVANAISKIPDAAGRASASVAIFGKSGVDMTGLFSDGLEGLNGLMAEAESLGIGVSDDDLAKAAAADDAIQKIKMSMGAMFDKAAVAFAPMITNAANFVIRLGDVGGTFQSVLQTGVDWYNTVSGLFQDVGVVVGVLVADIDNVWAGMFQDIPKYAQAAFQWIQENSKAIFANIATAAENMWNRVETKSRQLGEWIAYQAGWSDEMLDIQATQAKPMQQLTEFKAPELSGDSQKVFSDIASELALSRQQRSQVTAGTIGGEAKLSKLDDNVLDVNEELKTGSAKNKATGGDVALKGSADAMKTIFASRQDAAVKATNNLTNVVKASVAKPLQQIAANTQPQFAPEFT